MFKMIINFKDIRKMILPRGLPKNDESKTIFEYISSKENVKQRKVQAYEDIFRMKLRPVNCW